MDKELELLSDWLKYQNDLPKKRIHKETLLDIAGIDHLENHWSDIYAYFFNPKASHGLSRLFIDSLQDILCSKTNIVLAEERDFWSKYTRNLTPYGGRVKVISEPRLGEGLRVSVDYDGVTEVFEVTGDQDIIAIVDVESSQHLNDIIERVRRYDNILSTRTRLILKEHFGEA